jgi:hypothetical protein
MKNTNIEISKINPWERFNRPMDILSETIDTEQKLQLLKNWKDYYLQLSRSTSEGLAGENSHDYQKLSGQISEVNMALEKLS